MEERLMVAEQLTDADRPAAFAPEVDVDPPDSMPDDVFVGKVVSAACWAWLDRDGALTIRARLKLRPECNMIEELSILRVELDGFVDPSVFLAKLQFTANGRATSSTLSYIVPGDKAFPDSGACRYVVLLDASDQVLSVCGVMPAAADKNPA